MIILSYKNGEFNGSFEQRHRREQKDRDRDFPVNCDHEAERTDDCDDARE